MYSIVTENEFIDKMSLENFTTRGAKLLFGYITESETTNTGIRFDAVHLGQTFTEYTVGEFNLEYGTTCRTIDEVRNHATVVIEISESEFIMNNLQLVTV